MTAPDGPLAGLSAAASPFVSMAATDPWSDPISHVKEINGEALEGLLSLIDRRSAFPHDKLGCVIVGQAGGGRSHLLQSLCHQIGHEQVDYAFAAIQPIQRAEAPFSHLLREIISNLAQRPANDRSSTLLGRIVSRAIASFLNERAAVLDEPMKSEYLRASRSVENGVLERLEDPTIMARLIGPARRWFTDHQAQIWPDFLRVLFQYPQLSRRSLVVSWLRGDGLDDGEYRDLGLRPPSVEPTPGEKEEFAARCLTSLGLVMRCDRPLVVCFDQLEEIFRKKLTSALDHMIFHLFERVPHTIVVLSVRGDDLRRYFETCDEAVSHRLSHRIELVALDCPKALTLVRARLSTLALPSGKPDLYPFSERPVILEGLLAALEGTHSPRQVLQKAHQHWMKLFQAGKDAGDNPSNVFRAWLDRRKREILGDLDRWGPNDDVLIEALDLRFRHPPDDLWCDVERCAPAGVDMRYVDPLVRTRVGKKTRTVGFLVNAARDHRSVGAALRHGLSAWTSRAVDGLVFLRDGRAPFPDEPQWPRTNRLKDKLTRRGALFLTPLTLEEIADIFALVHLHQAILAEDVTCRGPDGGERRLSLSEFEPFVRRHVRLPRQEEIIGYCRGL